jgi:hypothetical protein
MGLDISHVKLVHYTPDDPYDFLRVDEWSIDCSVPLENYSSYVQTIKQFDDEEPFDGMFFIDVGYQRKGMSEQFYKDIPPDWILGRIEDVLKIMKYIDHDDSALAEQLRDNFQKNFIDNFEFGISLVLISW